MKALTALNISAVTLINLLYIFDRHDDQEKKYLKGATFILGLAGIVNVYKYSKLGDVVDNILESDFFSVSGVDSS